MTAIISRATAERCQADLRQSRGDLSSVRLTTPGGELRGEFALDVFEALRLVEACAAEPEEGEA